MKVTKKGSYAAKSMRGSSSKINVISIPTRSIWPGSNYDSMSEMTKKDTIKI